ncbi:hypothetical protein [Rhizobium glycinendophyticum]|uniref:Uncharacterized protein n=1 Tax=Rhizobium glycinendophyticum TaxID=2589807 RepID=A0A504TNJ5_9HYPH|nr:hypothetical protein [Rhizobium glycinendophyticum]TPP04218.1 hypothetical protein FJQ55_22420 [Rhizobium glycinendophyticum]
MIHPVIDFQVYRLRRQYGTLRLRYSNSPTSLHQSPSAKDSNGALSNDTTALVTALVLSIARRRGRSLDALPGTVRDALCDLVAQNDPTARLLFQWLDREQNTDEAIMEAARLPDRGRCSSHMDIRPARVYRHHRFWKSDSPHLAELDRRRLSQLKSLLEEEIRHDR